MARLASRSGQQLGDQQGERELMGWEIRRNRRYYYRKIRIGERVASRYVGTSTAGDLGKANDRAKKRRRVAEQRCCEQADAADTELIRASELLGAAADALLPNSGCYKHKGQWRRKRQ